MLDPMTNPDVHRKDCGAWGFCDCDAHRITFVHRFFRHLIAKALR